MNQEIIQRQIYDKMYSTHPYFPPVQEIFEVKTDVDEQPYRRFFRGNPNYDRPIVWEREAGYARIVVETATPTVVAEVSGPPCFQIPCSTVLPCQQYANSPLSSRNACVYSSP